MISGIYQIKNINDGKVYIGSSSHVLKRFKQHKNMLKRGKHHSSHLQHAWNMYGAGNFSFEIVERVTDTKDLALREQCWIDLCSAYTSDSGYNMARYVDCPTRGCSRPEVTKRKISESLVGHKGCVVSEERRQAMHIAYSGENNPFYHKQHTTKTRELISFLCAGKKNARYRKDITLDKILRTVKFCDTKRELCKKLLCSITSLNRAFKEHNVNLSEFGRKYFKNYELRHADLGQQRMREGIKKYWENKLNNKHQGGLECAN